MPEISLGVDFIIWDLHFVSSYIIMLTDLSICPQV